MTQCERVLAYIEKHGSITSAEAFEQLGCARLASRINDIKRRGHEIVKVWVTAPNRYGETVRFARYSIKKVGELNG